VLILALAWGFLATQFDFRLLLLDTTPGGGDTPSFLRPVHHLRDVLLPAGNPQGWELGSFCGYAPYQFYFLPPSLLIVALSYLIPLNVAFKLVTAAGTFLLPLMTLLSLRAMPFPFPIPALGAVASLIFLFNEGNSMWGGNIPSTLAGEFAHSLGFAFAVLFMGLLYGGIQKQKGWKSGGVVLAIAGLCHPVAFLNAAVPGLFFFFDRQNFTRNVRYIALTYGTAVLLMSFWLVPLMAKIGFATSINWTWHFNSVWDLLPKVMYPVLVLAGLDVVWMAFSRRPTDRPGHYILFSAVATTLFFFNATALGLPEIRFVPFVYFLLILLALDLVNRLLQYAHASEIGALALAATVLWWVQSCTTFIPSWIRWNYEGLERKPSWTLLTSIMGAVKGKISDPRVAYENSPMHERFGSMRIFEDMAMLSGRATLEGVLLQTDVMSPYIYWLQSLLSKQGTGVIPGYPYPSMDMGRATPRLAMLNASDMIAVTPEITQALESDARWQKIFSQPPYSVFHMKDADPHYVRVPKFQPVLFETMRWKRDFHRWFANDADLDVPIVNAATVPDDERASFRGPVRALADLPREPVEGGCTIDEHVDHMGIDFTTSCPGKPHIVAVSFYPNWKVEGARRIYLVSPAFMLVFPDGPHVRLTFGRVGADWAGILMTVLGIVVCAVPLRRATAGDLAPVVARPLLVLRPWFIAILLVVSLVGTAFSFARDDGATFFYQRGWKAFSAQDYASALPNFKRSLWLGGESTTAADAAFFVAATLLRENKPAEALPGYQRVIDQFPDSMWVAESHYHVGLCLRQTGQVDEAKKKFQYVIDTYPGNRWAGFAKEQLQQLAAQGG
jgi:hypothetical protein